MNTTKRLFLTLITQGCLVTKNSLHLSFVNVKRNFFTNLDKRKEYNGRKLVGFSMEQMYTVVADVSNYNKFIPFCKKSTVIDKKQKYLVAELQIGFPPIYESYTSNVKMCKPTMVRAVCSDGKIFSYLETCWKFSPGLRSNPQSCIVDFTIEFEFKSKLHFQVANMFFEALVRQMEGAFLSEAKRRFGTESIPSHKLAYIKS